MARRNPLLWIGIAIGAVVLLSVVLAGAAFVASPMSMMGLPFALMMLLMVGNVAVIIAAVVHALVRDDLTGTQRIVWVLLAVFVVPMVAVGAIAYFALGRERTRELFRDVAPQPGAAAPPQP